MSDLARTRRNRIIAAVLVIGLAVGAAQIVAAEMWSDWTIGIFTPIALQVLLLAYAIDSILSVRWAEMALMIPLGLIFYAAFSWLALAHLLVPESQRRLWAGRMLILLLLGSAIGWWSNWPLLQWGPGNRWRTPLACAGAALAVVSLIAYWFWRRHPDGRAAFWYPTILQVWIQSLWIPWPDED